MLAVSEADIKNWWESLTTTEQHIEMALTATDGDEDAKFDNIYDFNYSAQWVEDRRQEIAEAAQAFNIDPVALETMLMSELLYDYETKDQLQDEVLRAIHGGPSWDGAGVGNVHYWTLIDAYNYSSEVFEVNPYTLDENAPDLSNAPDLEYGDDLNEVPGDLQAQIGTYITSDAGTIRTAAMVTSYKIHLFMQANSGEEINPENLSPNEIARVFNAYRGITFEEQGNYRLALPVAEYLKQIDR